MVVTGHGQVGDKRVVRENIKFINDCIDMVRKAIKQGMNKEEAANKISFGEGITAVHPGSWQQRLNVIRLYEVLSK